MSNNEKLYVVNKQGLESLNPKVVYIISVACGITVANLYWAQPLLDSIANAFNSTTTSAGLVVTFTQIGYAVGLIFLVPLGDLLERKNLILFVLSLAVLSLVAAAISPSISIFLISSLAIGITSVVAQVLVPFSATLARDHERGKVVGQVMSGLLLGILLARTFSGFVSEYFGWSAIFVLAAILIFILIFVLKVKLPQNKMSVNLNYPKLLKSVWDLVKTEPLLRRRSLYGALVFANFSVLWTSLTFLLARPPYNYSDAIIGLFGLVGASGATSAIISGRLADRGYTRITTGFFLFSILFSFVCMFLGEHVLFLLIIGIVVLDLGVQGTHILNQSEIYSLEPEARSRLTTAYMTSFFVGGAIGSAASATIYSMEGWFGVCVLGGIFSVTAIIVWFTEFNSKSLSVETPANN